MRIRRTRWACILGGSLLWLSGGLVLFWAVVSQPVCETGIERDVPPAPTPAVAQRDSHIATPPPLATFEPLWDRQLRRPLVDPPPVVPEPPPKPAPPPLRVKLLATMIEADGATAMFSTADGATVFRQAGQPIDDSEPPANILEIRPNHVLLRYADEDVTLAIAGSGGN